MTDKRQTVGEKGETIAEKYLLDNGYTILAKNYSAKKGEIDFVALEGDVICFVEVKARTNLEMGRPEDAVTFSKKRQIIKAAKRFLYEKNCITQPCRFDVVAIVMPDNAEPQIELFKNAFRLDDVRMKL